jgi:hypothetical protein
MRHTFAYARFNRGERWREINLTANNLHPKYLVGKLSLRTLEQHSPDNVLRVPQRKSPPMEERAEAAW